MFNVLRQLERWLHQHIFKVGWLLTKNFQTTTILYYTFFLPGVFLHEVVYWLSAGALDVRADRSIAWPEKQEIGELRLNFVKLSSKASSVKVAVISITPLLVGLIFISFVANSIFDVNSALDVMHDGRLQSISTGIKQLMAAPDFWLWSYVLFTVSNTMMPDPNALRGWRWVAIALVVITVLLFIIGVGDEVVGSTITGPIADVLNVLSSIFAVVIVSNLVAVGILGSIEAIIERITGDSATFRNGKMVVMRREELIAQRKRERNNQRTDKKPRHKAATAQGPPSVYRFVLPIPGPPGKEPVTRKPAKIVDSTNGPALVGTTEERPRRIEPDVVDGTKTGREIRFGPTSSDENETTADRRDRAVVPGIRSPLSGGRRGERDRQRKVADAERGAGTDTGQDSEQEGPASGFARRSESGPFPTGDEEGQDVGNAVSAPPTASGQRPQGSTSSFRRAATDADDLADADGDEEVSARPTRFGQGTKHPPSPFRRTSFDEDELADDDSDAEVLSRLSDVGRGRLSASSPSERGARDDELTYEDVEESP